MIPIFNPEVLAGKHVVVAGATSGLGRAVATACAEAGATICAIGRSQEKLSSLLATLGARHQMIVGELSCFEGAVEAFQKVRDLIGGADAVFYAAGTEVIKPTRTLTASDVDATMGAALHGALGAAKVCASKRFWRATGRDSHGGSLLFMTSVAARSGQNGMSAYAAARAGLSGLARNLAVELSPLNVRVNTIMAGAVATEMHSRITSGLPHASQRAYHEAHPLGIGQPRNIADLSIFLISDAAAWITGTDIVIDGGFLA
jgi:NAD(P)-dependent dehydrogenase (short-subunit alcohol dehydrogenase family)